MRESGFTTTLAAHQKVAIEVLGCSTVTEARKDPTKFQQARTGVN